MAVVQLKKRSEIPYIYFMENIKIATAQFENRSGDKEYNLGVIRQLAAKAAAQGAQVVAFRECSVTGYTFAMPFSRKQMLDLAEFIPDGPSVTRLIAIAKELNITILAGLFEKDAEGKIYKTQVCVDKNGLVAKYHKLHPFINKHLTPGNHYVIYASFSNPIGMDDDQLKNGCSMIIDPFGDIIAECRSFDNEIVIATITAQKLTDAGGYRYIQARRPELYGDIIAQPHKSEQK